MVVERDELSARDVAAAVGVAAAAHNLSPACLALAVRAAVLGFVGRNAGADGISAFLGVCVGHDAPLRTWREQAYRTASQARPKA